MPLSEKQRRRLKGVAHQLKPVVIVGQHGLTETVFNELGLSLNTHELIKVRINAADRDERREMVRSICETADCELVQTIGHVGVFYRRHPKKPKIKLPE